MHFSVDKHGNHFINCLISVSCCVNRRCWCFATRGMCTVGQDEVVIVLECTAEETNVPRDIFTHLHSIFEDANRGI